MCVSTQTNAATNAGISSVDMVRRCEGDHCVWSEDELAIEEPLQIRLAGEDVAVTMRTPGHDAELAIGFLYTEGVIQGKHHVEAVAHCPDHDGSTTNIVNVSPTERNLLEPGRWGRNFYATSSCGLCGKTSISQVRSRLPSPGSHLRVRLDTLYALEGKLRVAQYAFAQTGGMHAAALFDEAGELLALREDVGRHNAVDKVIGYAMLHDMLPLEKHILLVSSRASFEIVQKALMVGVSVMAALSAPSSLAVELAREAGMTLVAFLRRDRLNVYSGAEWVEP